MDELTETSMVSKREMPMVLTMVLMLAPETECPMALMSDWRMEVPTEE